VAAAGASADSGQSGLATQKGAGRLVQGTLAPGGPRTWHVLPGFDIIRRVWRPKAVC